VKREVWHGIVVTGHHVVIHNICSGGHKPITLKMLFDVADAITGKLIYLDNVK